MLRSSTPLQFPIPFGASAGGSFIRPIPVASQIGIQAGAASLTDGFVPLNATQIAAGGVPPFEQDMNGILNQATAWCRWLEAGAPIYYDGTFSTGSGGYPQGAIIQSNVVPGDFWMSTADNNTTDPDSVSAANWVPDPGRIKPGDLEPSLLSTVPTGFVASNTLTVGNASSNATGRANADTLLLFRQLWVLSPSLCPIFTSTGASSTRGANPDADFAANKALGTPDMRGRDVIGVDTMGGPATTRLTGVPVTSGNATTPGSVVGENLHNLIAAETPTITVANASQAITVFGPNGHSVYSDALIQSNSAAAGATSYPTSGANSSSLQFSGSNSISATSNNTGGTSPAHNNVEQSVTVYWNIKL